MYEYYSDGKYFEGETRVASLVKFTFSLIIFTIGYYAYNRTSEEWKDTRNGRVFNLLLLLEIVSVAINFVSIRVNLIDRLDLYFTALSCVFISNSISLLPVYKRRIFSISLLLLFISYNCVVMSFRPDWNRVYPIELEWKL